MKKKSKAQNVAEQALVQIALLLRHRLPTRKKVEARALVKLLDRAYASAYINPDFEIVGMSVINLDEADVLLAVRNFVANEIGDDLVSHSAIQNAYEQGKLE